MNCVICLDPTSLCVCEDQPATKLALQIVRDAPGEPEVVTIGREAFILLCERAYGFGQQQSKAARAEAGAQWISVKDRVPDNPGRVLILWGDGFIWCGWHLSAVGWVNGQSAAMPDQNVTHWMPLPSPPMNSHQGEK